MTLRFAFITILAPIVLLAACGGPTAGESSTAESALQVGAGGSCGGNIANARTCAPGLVCSPRPGQTLPVGDVGGICLPPR